MLSCKPNNAHHAIARFLRPEYRESIAPHSKSCTLITQNVDGLSVRAKEELDSIHPPQQNGSMSLTKQGEIIEMHGRLLETLCTNCQERRPDVRSPICPALAGTEVRTEAVMDEQGKRVPEENIAIEDLPHCEKEGCNGLLRPAVVWFGESIPGLGDIDDVVDRADFCIVVGTSSVVSASTHFPMLTTDFSCFRCTRLLGSQVQSKETAAQLLYSILKDQRAIKTPISCFLALVKKL